MFSKKPAAATETRHHRADRYRKNVRDFLVRKFLHVNEEHHRTKLRWNFVERRQDFAVRDFLCYSGWLHEVRFQELFVFLQQWKPEPLPTLMTDAMKENLVKPGAAVGTCFEAPERSPGLKIDLLNRIFCVAAISRHPQRCPEEIVKMRHRLRLKAFFGGAAGLSLEGTERLGALAREWRMVVPSPASHRL